MAEALQRRRALPIGFVVGVILGLIPLAEPIIGVFRRTVLLNLIFMAILALVTLLALTGLLLARQLAHAEGPGVSTSARVVLAVAAVEVVFLLVVWVAIGVTGAYRSDGTPDPGGRSFELVPQSVPR